MRSRRYGVTTAVAIICFALCSTTATAISDIWADLHPKLSEAVDLLAKQKTVPDSTWNPFEEDKKSIEEEIDELVEEALEVLGDTELLQIKAQIDEHLRAIQEYKATIAEYNTKKIGAPEDISEWQIWKKDRDDYDEAISDYKTRIKESEAAIDDLKEQLRDELASIGIEATDDQIDTMLFSVTADDDLQLISVFNNIKDITEQLKKLTIESEENIENAKRYYGMHVILIKILLSLHSEYVNKIDTVYQPKISEILTRNGALIQKTKNLLRQADPDHKPIYQGNLDAQRLTEKTAKLYRTYLNNEKKRIQQAHSEVLKEFEAAENTYETVTTAHSLVSLMKNANETLKNISALQMPELISFKNAKMKEEFAKLSKQIATGS